MIQQLFELKSALLKVIIALETDDLATKNQINQLKQCEEIVSKLIDAEIPDVGLTD